MTPAVILLASHRTAGARVAEETALALCAPGGTIRHLEVVPDFWKGMRGDDWLNNAITQQRFGEYVESELQRELAEHAEALGREARGQGLSYENIPALGKPAECLLAAAAGQTCDLVVVGSPRPKGTPGYRSRLKLDIVVRELRVPLLVVPHPGR
ncbi:MAG: universal stress protein [Alphaproteobacteria bacterium]|nr:universal stress protein [Alphaproteobacteria bacterium]